MTKEQSLLTKIMKVFASEEILLQRSVLSYKTDSYFSKHRLAMEIDGKKRQKVIEKKT